MDSEPTSPTTESAPSPRWRPLRAWPALALVLLMVVIRIVPRLMDNQSMSMVIAAMMGPLICGVLILIWWLTASRATWKERIAGLIGVLGAFAIISGMVDPTIRGSGFIYPMAPLGLAGFAIGAAWQRNQLSFRRTWIAVLLSVVGFGSMVLFRNSGMSGDYALKLHWRWAATPEDLMLAERSATAAPGIEIFDPALIREAAAQPDWPGFRGAERTSTYGGPAITSDWNALPPELLWKTAMGPGWSSFAVAGDYLFTQEQRGPLEAVACYQASTGREVWISEIESRFADPLGGPGPRATPVLADGKLLALGSEGWLMRLDPGTGEVIWKQDIRQVADRDPPQWGFSSSPLVIGSSVIVHAGGKGDKGTLAFDLESGDLRWSAASGDHSYSSPHPATIAGVEGVLMMTNRGVEFLDPESGASLLNYEWAENTYRALQPQVVDSDSLLVATGMNFGTRRVRISKEGDDLASEDLWTSRKLKPDFNDFVVHEGHAYGFDASIFACIDLATGERRWKGGRYGKGQVLLLEQSGFLLVAGEQGEIVLLKATPESPVELARFQALNGKTWNHPVVVGDRLFVRNAQEAACYRLRLAVGGGSVQ